MAVCVFILTLTPDLDSRPSVAPHHVDQSHHNSQFQEAPGVCRKAELSQQQV